VPDGRLAPAGLRARLASALRVLADRLARPGDRQRGDHSRRGRRRSTATRDDVIVLGCVLGVLAWAVVGLV